MANRSQKRGGGGARATASPGATAPAPAAEAPKRQKPARKVEPKPPEAKREGEIAVGVAARLIMVGERRVQQLATGGWIKKPYTVVGVVQGYIRFLQDEQRKGSRGSKDDAVKDERARKLRNENDKDERITLRTDDAIAALDAIVGPIKSELAGVAPQVTDDIHERRRIEDAIDAVLDQVAKRFDKACADLLAGRDALEAEPEAEAEPVREEQDVSADGGPAG
jgi:hypothetical protein